MARLWARLDRLASLTMTGLPTRPLDPDNDLADVERALLGEWQADWASRVADANKKAMQNRGKA